MPFNSQIFDAECRDLGNGNHLHFVNIPTLNDDMSAYIDSSIISICEGESEASLAAIKQRLIARLSTKRGSTLEMGAIAEFFCHLYLGEIGFMQEFLFLNLEEGSIKKGFDGYYSLNGEEWIYESKSGSAASQSVSHKSKIAEAYTDLRNKIAGKTPNNPWQNAYNHACHVDVGTANAIRKNLKTLADAFTQGAYQDIGSFNILPSSTFFLGDSWHRIDCDGLAPRLQQLLNGCHFTKIHVICVNKASIDLFWEYLEG